MKKLIINADDFGISQAVNRAILDCFIQGSLDSATLMVNMLAADEAVEMSIENNLSVGLHFNLTLGQPISDVCDVVSLVNENGEFYSRREFIKRYVFKKISHQDIETEFHAQVEKFASFGLDLDHIDSHQHIHVLPQIFDKLAAYCVASSIPLRTLKQGRVKNNGLNKLIRRAIIQRLNNRNEKKWKNHLTNNCKITSIFDYISKQDEVTFDLYQACIKNVEEGVTELMVHPLSNASEREKGLTRISSISQKEYDILISDQFKKLLKDEHVNRIGFSEI